jgi:hypothetical protein
MKLVDHKNKKILVPSLEEFCEFYPIIANKIYPSLKDIYHTSYFPSFKKYYKHELFNYMVSPNNAIDFLSAFSFISPENIRFLSDNEDKIEPFLKQSFMTDAWSKCILFAMILKRYNAKETISSGKKLKNNYISAIRNMYFMGVVFIDKYEIKNFDIDNIDETRIFEKPASHRNNFHIFVSDGNFEKRKKWQDPAIIYKSEMTVSQYGIENLKFVPELETLSLLKYYDCDINLSNKIDKNIFEIDKEDIPYLLWKMDAEYKINDKNNYIDNDKDYFDMLFSLTYGSDQALTTSDIEMKHYYNDIY